ncbi:hypothetical protein N234_22895 [Ralstonia pickettii DTP0602]|nr:hypothetical protein N234_22895 [Ralstonia pickettii DTP0602]
MWPHTWCSWSAALRTRPHGLGSSEGGPMTIWPLAFLGMLIALYALIIRVGIHRKPVLHKAKHSLRYWRNRLAHVAR